MPFDVDGNTYPHLSGALIDLATVDSIRFDGTGRSFVSLTTFGLALELTLECGKALEKAWKKRDKQPCFPMGVLVLSQADDDELETIWRSVGDFPDHPEARDAHPKLAFEMFCRGLLEEQTVTV